MSKHAAVQCVGDSLGVQCAVIYDRKMGFWRKLKFWKRRRNVSRNTTVNWKIRTCYLAACYAAYPHGCVKYQLLRINVASKYMSNLTGRYLLLHPPEVCILCYNKFYAR